MPPSDWELMTENEKNIWFELAYAVLRDFEELISILREWKINVK
jgi:hypothetical protein